MVPRCGHSDSLEPMLNESMCDRSKYVLRPTDPAHPDLWAWFKRHEASFWTAEEIDLSQDLSDFESLSDTEKRFLEVTLAFFAFSDGVVNQNIQQNLSVAVQYPEARAFYSMQMLIETIHAETYTLMIDALVKDPVRREELLNVSEGMECVRQKAEWAERWMHSTNACFAERLVAFAFTEGVNVEF